jgi:hypothetical protein
MSKMRRRVAITAAGSESTATVTSGPLT